MADKIDITRRKVLASVGAVGAAGAAAGYGTSALFSDTESFGSNTIAAGELDLKVDWQQKYFGPGTNGERFGTAYGSAGRPWVNAHPDEGEPNDPNGIQSLDTDQYGSLPQDGVVTYEDDGRNIQEYLTCETLDHDYDFGPNEDSLVELSDVKPGDSGEVTFSFHLCDNPGYVWFCAELVEAGEGGTTEPERNESPDTGDANETTTDPDTSDEIEILDKINARAWYDVDCDNELESGEEVLAGGQATSLRSFLSDFPGSVDNCLRLNPSRYNGGGGGVDCTPIGEVNFTDSGLAPQSGGTVIRRDTYTGDFESNEYETYVLFEEGGNDVLVRFFEFQEIGDNGNDGDVVTASGSPPGAADLSELDEFDYTRVPPDVEIQANVSDISGTFSSDDFGFCESTLTDTNGNSNTADLIGQSCGTGEEDVSLMTTTAIPLESFALSYCKSAGESDCFPASETYCVGFEWTVPEDVGNEIQSDYVKFNVGFYTEQCRNNDDPGQGLR